MSTHQNAARRQLHETIGKFPLTFAKAVVFGERPPRAPGAPDAKISNATSLLRLDCGPVAVTCHHVVSHYKERPKNVEECQFQIGGCRIDVLSQCICDSPDADLTVLRLTEEQAAKITEDGWPGSHFFVPASRPLKHVAIGDDVAFGGYPGQWRRSIDYDTLEVAGYTQCSRVSDVGISSFICECRRESWVSISKHRDADSLTNYGGISGGPAFVWRNLHWDFAGVVRQYFPDSDVVRVAHAALITADGDICM